MTYQRELLHQALQTEDRDLAKSIIDQHQSGLGVHFMVVELQRFTIENQGQMSDSTTDLTLDLMMPLMEKLHHLEDANYVAPNLSPEVSDLLLFICDPMLLDTLQSGSPNWMMIPHSTWVKFVKLSEAACVRHSGEEEVKAA